MRLKNARFALQPAALSALIAFATAPAIAQTAEQATAQTTGQATAPNGVGSAFELAFWQSVTGSEDAATYEAYLARYPDGTFAGLARARIASIQRTAPVQPTAAPVPAAQQTPAPLPAVQIIPQAASLAPPPAVADVSPAPAPSAAEMIPASARSTPAAPASVAQAAPTPLARLLAQLRGSGEAAPQLVTTAPPVQPQPPAAVAPASAPAASYASTRPLLLPVPEVTLPAAFCSTDARNQFHNSAYRPAVEVASRNNEAAAGYLRQLQQTYDRGQLGRDTAVLNAIAAEARAYQAEAAQAYAVQAALVRQFDALMAVPLRACVASSQ